MSATTTVDNGAKDYRILGAIGIGHFMSHFYYMTLPPIFVQLKEAFGASYAELGLLLALMAGAAAVVQVPVGFLVDRLGARIVLAAGLIVAAIATALMGFATSFWMLVALAFMSGVGNAVFHPADYAILNSSISAARMGRAFSLHTFTGSFGTAAAPIIMFALTAWLGWRMALVAAGVLGAVALVLLITQWSVLETDVEARPADKPETKQAGSAAGIAVPADNGLSLIFSWRMIVFFLFFTTLSMTQSAFQSFTVTALTTLHGTSLAIASTALSVFLFATTAGVLLGGEISDRTTRHDLVAAAVFVLSAAICLALALLNLPVALLMLVMAVMGIGLGITRPARDMMLRAAAPKGSAGKVFGFVTSGIAVGSALAPIPFGWLLDIGQPAWVFYLLAIFFMVALLTVMTPKEPAAR